MTSTGKAALEDDLPRQTGGTPDFVFLGMPDVHGSLRGKAFTGREFDAVVRRGHTRMTDLLLALDPVDEPITDYATLGLRSGAGDLVVTPELHTLRPMPWRPGWQLCLATPRWSDGSPCELAPREVLRRTLDALGELGHEAMAAFEYEVRLFRRDGSSASGAVSYSLAELAPFQGLAEELQHALAVLGVDLSAVHTEAGQGLLELNIGAARGLHAADHAVLVKTAVKEVARTHGFKASFLAKTAPGEEGSSGHLHVSLWDGDEASFAGGIDGKLGAAVAGVLAHMPAASALYNPNINSYKRLVPGFFAPVNATWGVENRSAAVRVIAGGDASAARLELRRPGADANPYLALAGAVASVVLGLRAGQAPPAPVSGDAADLGDEAPPLPASLEAATEAFAQGAELRQALGEEFAAYYETSRRWELRAWQRAVTGWERDRYEDVV